MASGRGEIESEGESGNGKKHENPMEEDENFREGKEVFYESEEENTISDARWSKKYERIENHDSDAELRANERLVWEMEKILASAMRHWELDSEAQFKAWKSSIESSIEIGVLIRGETKSAPAWRVEMELLDALQETEQKVEEGIRTFMEEGGKRMRKFEVEVKMLRSERLRAQKKVEEDLATMNGRLTLIAEMVKTTVGELKGAMKETKTENRNQIPDRYRGERTGMSQGLALKIRRPKGLPVCDYSRGNGATETSVG